MENDNYIKTKKMPELFMTIGKGDSTWRNKILNGNVVELAPFSYQICICVTCDDDGPHKDYWLKGHYQGCFFVKNPILNMLLIDFIKLVKKINETIKKIYPDYPIFKGSTYVEIYPHLIKCIDDIIELFKNETCNNQWCYEESCDINNKLYNADNFIKKWWKKTMTMRPLGQCCN